MAFIEIRGLKAEVDGLEILRGIDLDIKKGDVFGLLGPNGHGKSTLLTCLMGNPHYQITEGSIKIDGEEIVGKTPDEISKMGVFYCFQNPPEIQGVVSMDFYKAAINAHREKPIGLFEYYKSLEQAYKDVGLPSDMKERHLNDGFSGGEKKRNEILQMLLLKPKICMLDEIDSGLDVDAIKTVGESINKLEKEGTTFIIVSHYARLFDEINPTKSAVIINGKVGLTGGPDLIKRVDTEGYTFLKSEYGIDITKTEEKAPNMLGECFVANEAKNK